MAAHQAPPSPGFSRQEHWSGLPLPSPMHESEMWQWSCSVMSDSQWPHGLQPTSLLRSLDFSGKRTGVGCHCLLEYQIVRTHTKETTWIQDRESPNHQEHSVQDALPKQQTKQIYTQSSADRVTTPFSFAHQRKNKQTKTRYKSHPIRSLQKPLGQS